MFRSAAAGRRHLQRAHQSEDRFGWMRPQLGALGYLLPAAVSRSDSNERVFYTSGSANEGLGPKSIKPTVTGLTRNTVAGQLQCARGVD